MKPPRVPSQYSTHNIPQTAPHQKSSNVSIANTTQNPPEVQFQTNTPTRQPPPQTLSNTPAQTSNTQNTQPILTINTLHTKTLSNYTTSRKLS